MQAATEWFAEANIPKHRQSQEFFPLFFNCFISNLYGMVSQNKFLSADFSAFSESRPRSGEKFFRPFQHPLAGCGEATKNH